MSIISTIAGTCHSGFCVYNFYYLRRLSQWFLGLLFLLLLVTVVFGCVISTIEADCHSVSLCKFVIFLLLRATVTMVFGSILF